MSDSALPAGVSQADLERHERRSEAFEEAGAAVLPGALAEAFAGVPLEVAGLRVRPVVHWDFVALKRLNSPLLRQLGAKKQKRPEAPWTDDQGYEMIYQFTRPVDEIAGFFSKHGNAAAARFRDLARQEIGFKLGPVEVALLVKGVERAFIAAFATVLNVEPKDPDGGFQSPPAGPKTGSVGG